MDLDSTASSFWAAANAFAKGDPEPVKAMYAHTDDVVLANPFGPAVVGWPAVAAALDYASSRFRDGEVTAFEPLTRFVAGDLAVLHEVERWHTKVAGRPERSEFNLRVTTTYRREGDDWLIVHRHADPITTPDPDGPLRRSGV